MIDQLNAICRQAIRRPIAPDDDLIKHGLTTNRALKIIKIFWAASGIELDVNVFYRHRSVRAIVEAIKQGRTADEKIFLLREGDGSKPLFVYAGGVNCFLEMQELIDALDFEGVIYGIGLTDFNRAGDDPPSVAEETAACYAAIKAMHPEGSYRLMGFSFGGVLALEVARKLTAEGADVTLLVMIDSPQNDHSWLWRDWSGLMLKIVSRQVKARFRLRERRQVPRDDKASHDGVDGRPRANHQILFRFRDPRNPRYPLFAPQWAGGYTPHYGKVAKQLLQMKGLFRPRAYDGRVVFVHSKGGSSLDCDARTIWQRYLPRAEWVVAAGNHLSMMMGRNARSLASDLDEKLETGPDSQIAKLRAIARQARGNLGKGRPIDETMEAGDSEPTAAPSQARGAAKKSGI